MQIRSERISISISNNANSLTRVQDSAWQAKERNLRPSKDLEWKIETIYLADQWSQELAAERFAVIKGWKEKIRKREVAFEGYEIFVG